MFSDYFKLKLNPFGETPNTRFFFKSKSHVDAISQILNAIKGGHGFSTITGEVGVGKTILSRMLLNYLGKHLPSALILNPIMNQLELLTAIREEFKIEAPTEKTVKSEYDQIAKFLIETAINKKKSVLIVDEAQRLSFDAFEAVRLLSNLETEDQKLMHIILVGQPELNMKLGEFELRQLNQRISVRAKISALNQDEVAAYIKHRIEISGGANFVRFETSACKLIFERTGGVPRLINFLVEEALIKAEASQTRLIEDTLILEISPAKKPKWRMIFEKSIWNKGPSL